MELAISIGALAAVTTCVIELLVVPLFELCRNKLSGFMAGKEINAGREIFLYRSTLLMSYFGLGSIIRFPSIWNRVFITFRASLKLLVIIAVVLWESQLKIGYRRSHVTTKLGFDGKSNTSVTLVSPFPLYPVFIGNTSCQNKWFLGGSSCFGDRLMHRAARLQVEYVANCVELLGDRTVIYYAIATLSQSGNSVVCLNGKEGTDKRVLLTFSTLHSNILDSKIIITSLVLSDDGYVDPETRLGPYRAVITAKHPFHDRNETYDGYFTFAGRTHRDNNVAQSAYGVMVNRKTGKLETTSIAITQGSSICSGHVIGEWSFKKGTVYCPSGDISYTYPSSAGYHEMNLTRYKLSTGQEEAFGLEDALAWILETPLHLFNSYGGGEQEMRLRYSIMPLFYSYQDGKELRLRTGEQHETTELHDGFTIFLVCVLSTTLLFCVSSSAMYFVTQRRSQIATDFDDPNNLLAMWRHASGVANGLPETSLPLNWRFCETKKSPRVTVWKDSETKDEFVHDEW